MSLATEAVTSPGSGLVFINYYDASVTEAYRGAILVAEHILQGLFTDATTVGISFDLSDLGPNIVGSNAYSAVAGGYATFVAALQDHATTASDFTAVAGLPLADPSGGLGFSIPTAEARILGLAAQSNIIDDSVSLSSTAGFTFGQDAVGVLLHEITEGVFGRVGSLGLQTARWSPMDLFRFTSAGVRDYTGGSDGVTTYFGIAAGQLSNLAYHNAINALGQNDSYDLADWDHTFGDAFGPASPSSPGVMSATDLEVLDVLGWRPTGSGAPYAPAPDDLASSLTDAARPFGQLAVGASVAGTLEQAGDRDWFRVTLEAGKTYTINLTGTVARGGSLGDAYLRLHDGSGALLVTSDDIVSGADPDSRIVFTATAGGTYYVEAGAFVDGYAGAYHVAVAANAVPTAGGDVLLGVFGGDTLDGLAGADTITGADAPNYLRGGDGDDVINGGAAFDDINGNMGSDTLRGGAGDDWVVGGKDNDLQFGDAGADVVLGNLGADTLDGGSGNDIVRGGQENDVLMGGSGDDYVSGDKGDDTVSGGSGADRFHSFGDAGLDRVLDFHSSEGDRVMLDPGSTWTVAQVGADTVVNIAGGAQVVLVGVSLSSLPDGWIFVG